MPETMTPPQTPVSDSPIGSGSDPMAELDSLSGLVPKPPVQATQKKEEAPKDEPKDPIEELDGNEPPKEPAKETPKEPVKETPKEAPKEAPKDDKPVAAKELRQALDNTKKENQALKAELEKLKKAPKTEDPERKVFLEKYEAEKKRRAEIEAELKLAKYEVTQEYKDKYETPLVKAFQSAYSDMKQLTITDAEGNKRPATDADFLALVHMPLGEAATQAREWFGDAASEVLSARKRIIQLNEERKEAIENYKKQAGEMEKTQSVEQAARAEKLRNVWSSTITEQQEKFPYFFAPDEEDPEGNEALEKGTKLADLAFSNIEMPEEKRAQLHATVRNKAAAFDRLALRNKKLNDQIESLKKELDEFKNSSPGGGDGADPSPSEQVMDWGAEIDKLSTQKFG